MPGWLLILGLYLILIPLALAPLILNGPGLED